VKTFLAMARQRLQNIADLFAKTNSRTISLEVSGLYGLCVQIGGQNLLDP